MFTDSSKKNVGIKYSIIGLVSKILVSSIQNSEMNKCKDVILYMLSNQIVYQVNVVITNKVYICKKFKS